MNRGELATCGGAPKPKTQCGWHYGCLFGSKMRGDERWSNEKTQTVIALGCPKPIPCEVCDGHGFYMVSAHGVQEIQCGECGGTGVKPPDGVDP